MRVLIVFAVNAEFAPWRKLRDFELIPARAVTLYRTQIGQATVDFVVSGMGLENARSASESAMSAPYNICIASGFAGSLRANHRVGEILIAQAVQQLGTSNIIECSRKLFLHGCHEGATPADIFLTTGKLVESNEKKKQLSLNGDAVDMESFAVLAAAKERNLPAVAIRAISDQMDEDMPANIDTTVDKRGRVRAGQILRFIASNPFQLPALLRLGGRSRTTAELLAKFLEVYIQKLCLDSAGDHPVELVEIAAT